MAWTLSADRYFDPEPQQRALARAYYEQVQALPIVSPHGHVDAALLANPDARLGTPSDLLIASDHYVFRMLYSQGVPLEDLGIPRREHDVSPVASPDVAKSDPRRAWQVFADHFHLFQGTPTGNWLKHMLIEFFGIHEQPNSKNAPGIYDQLEQQLSSQAFSPRALFKRFKLEVLCTTDTATDSLEAHQQLRHEGIDTVRPTFRPDQVIQVHSQRWREHLRVLGVRAGLEVLDYASFIAALEARRASFKALGALASDHDMPNPFIERLSPTQASELFDQALRSVIGPDDTVRLNAHLMLEMARMSSEDGLVMQLHVGSARNHNRALFSRFGANHGSDIPVAVDWTRGLQPLLESHGNDLDMRIILFTLDESTYGRELAPLAGHYPALRLGPPWWFFDSSKGIERYLDAVTETAGLYNLAGFNDDCRNFLSIPVRHDVWRRSTCNWLAKQVLYGVIEDDEAPEIATLLAYGLAKDAYRL